MALGEFNNLANDSVTFIRYAIPYQLKALSYIFRKYSQLIFDEFENLTEYKLGQLDQSLDKITTMPFSKLLMILNRDELVNFNNEIYNIAHDRYEFERVLPLEAQSHIVYRYSNNANNNMMNESTGRVLIEDIKYRYMIAPYLQLSAYFGRFWRLYENIPLIRVKPSIDFHAFVRNENSSEWNSFFQDRGTYRKDVNNFGIGNDSNIIKCDITIDIESLFTIFMSMLKRLFEKETSDNGPNDDITCDSGGDGYNVNGKSLYCLSYFKRLAKWFKEMNEEQFENRFVQKMVLEDLSRRMIFSTTSTFLATVSKVDKVNGNFLSEIADDILDVVKQDLTEDFVFESDYMNDRGFFMRHMTTNISTLLQAVALARNDNANEWQNDLFAYLQYLISTQFGFKYCTYNYLKIPSDNLKQKQLVALGYLGKMSTYLLNDENKMALQADYESNIEHGVTSFFLPLDAARINGTFALNKRFFDLGRSLLQHLSVFIILRYRLANMENTNIVKLPGVNVKQINTVNNIDDLGRNSRDYQTYLRDQYTSVKRAIGTIRSRIVQLTEGANVKNVGDWGSSRNMTDCEMISPDGRIGALANLIYGITCESLFTNTQLFSNLASSNDTRRVSQFNNSQNWNYTIEEVVNACNVVAERQLKRYNTKFENIRGTMSNALHSIWFTFIDSLCKMADYPWTKNVSDNSFTFLEMIGGWTAKSLSNLTPNIDQADITNKNGSNYCWNPTIQDELDKFQINAGVSSLSREALEKAIEYLEDHSGEDMFGMFCDGGLGGIPLAQEVTMLERENNNKNISFVPEFQQAQALEDMNAIKGLIKRFDAWLNAYH